MRRARTRGGFSLVELVVVIVIIGIIAAMAIPRLSRGSEGASGAAVSGDLAIMRNAIHLYAAEHMGKYPGHDSGDAIEHLTMFTNSAGDTSPTKTGAYIYGPYLVKVPPMPVGSKANPSDFALDTSNSPPVVTAGNEGWVYNPTTGEIIANSSATDSGGKAYSTY